MEDSFHIAHKAAGTDFRVRGRKRTNGILVRSKAQWIEEGKKNTKYFLNLEKRNYEKKNIKKIINDKGKEITNKDKIIKEEDFFYRN